MTQEPVEESISLKGVSVTIGMPVDNPIPHKTVISLVNTTARLAQMGIPFAISMHVCGVVQIGRDMVLDDFVQSNLTDKLFWIDSDMVWEPDDFLKLLALSTKVDVVGAAYPAKVIGPLTMYANFDKDDLEEGPYGLLSMKGIGLGFTVVSREVCEKLTANAPRVVDQIANKEMASVFRVDILNGVRRTEDMAFFHDIADLGYKVWVDPSITLGHLGEYEWKASLAQGFEMLEQEKKMKEKTDG